MTRPGVLLVLALGLAAALACQRSTPAAFPHAQHLHLEPARCAQRGPAGCPTCLDCHTGLRAPEENPTPSPSSCSPCHSPSEGWRLSRSRPSEGHPRVGQRILFSHRTHLALPKLAGQCVGCHAGVVDDDPGTSSRPSMAQCLECHDDEFQQGRCTGCHRSSDLRQLLPQTFLRHDALWARRHGAAAARSNPLCGSCHTESDCTSCHDTSFPLSPAQREPERIDRELVHRADFLSRHGMEASMQPATCLRCHQPSQCEGCHVARGVSAARLGSSNPHPIGWVGPDTASRNFHGRAARRDILSCTSCHDQGPATNCIGCHRVGGSGGNPHPRGWSSAQASDAPMCKYCHEP